MATDDIIEDIDEEPQEIDEQTAFVTTLTNLYDLADHRESEIMKAASSGDAETLSISTVSLARLNSKLGKMAAKAKYFARLAERSYKAYRDELKLSYIDQGNSVAKAESKASIEAKDMFNSYNEVQLLADEADDRCYRTDTLLKMAQSRLSLIKNDLR